jgi:membrane-associated phospholipid phosphatase
MLIQSPAKIIYLNKITLFVLLLIFSSNQVVSQYKYNFKTATNDFEEVIKQPSDWDKNDWLTIFGIAGLTYGTMHIDRFVRDQVLANHDYKNTIPIEFGRIWGEPLSTLAIGGSFYLHGLATDNNANKKLGFEIGEAAIYTSIITLFFKYAFGRERPRENADPFSYHPFSFRDDFFLSLSSGHTALAFSLSTVLAENTSNNYLKVVLFVPAFMTAFSRVYQNHHWTSDVLLGGIIGYSVAEFVTRLHKAQKIDNGGIIVPQATVNLFDFRIPF